MRKEFGFNLIAGLCLVLFIGCGSSNSSVVSGTSSSGSATQFFEFDQNPGPVITPSTASLSIQSVLARTIDASVTSFRVSGLDSSDQVIFGPVTFPKAATVLVEGIPLQVTQVRIEYLVGNVVGGEGLHQVSLVAGQVAQLTDPDFQEKIQALTIQPDADFILARRLVSNQFQAAFNSVLTGTTEVFTGDATWSTDTPALLTVANDGIVSSTGVTGTARITITPVDASLAQTRTYLIRDYQDLFTFTFETVPSPAVVARGSSFTLNFFLTLGDGTVISANDIVVGFSASEASGPTFQPGITYDGNTGLVTVPAGTPIGSYISSFDMTFDGVTLNANGPNFEVQ